MKDAAALVVALVGATLAFLGSTVPVLLIAIGLMLVAVGIHAVKVPAAVRKDLCRVHWTGEGYRVLNPKGSEISGKVHLTWGGAELEARSQGLEVAPY